MVDPLAMFAALQAYVPYHPPHTRCAIPHWLFDDYEAWQATRHRWIDTAGYSMLSFRGTYLISLHPALAVARGL